MHLERAVKLHAPSWDCDQFHEGFLVVPFEIGGAMGKARSCAHIVSEQVQSLPEYIKTAELLLDRWDLSKWVAKVSGEKHDVLKESIERHAGAFLGMVPRIRHKSEIRFYG